LSKSFFTLNKRGEFKIRKSNLILAIVFFYVLLFNELASTRIVSKNIVQNIAQNFLTQKRITQSATLEKQIGKTINRIEELNDPIDSATVAYIVNIEPKGFLVISPDTDLEPIVAYSFRHNWNSDTSRVNILYQILVKDMKMRKEVLLELPVEVIKQNNRKWQERLTQKSEILEGYSFQQWPEQGSTTTGGWVGTTWTQGTPFNNYCPLDLEGYGRSPVGCVVTAMSQIVNYHEFIGDLYFDGDDRYETFTRQILIDTDSTICDFPSFKRLNGYLARLENKYEENIPLNNHDKAVLSFACGILVKMDYSTHGSSASPKEVANALKDKMGYVRADYLIWDDTFSNTLMKNMINALPAFLTIEEHAILADGYNTDGFFHLNFGWGNNHPAAITDAWYIIPDYMPNNYDRIYNGILNIEPSLGQQTNISISDSIIYLPSSRIGAASDIQEFSVKNVGEVSITFVDIFSSDRFYIGTTSNSFSDSLGSFIIQTGNELGLYVRCIPDSFGRFEGKVTIIAFFEEVKRYLWVDLVGYGVPDDRTVVYEGGVSGIWDIENSPYYVCGDIYVLQNETLKITSGVQVVFAGQYQIDIGEDAQLIAKGTEGDSIHFIAENMHSSWKGFRFINSDDDDTLSYCVIKQCKNSKMGGAFWIGSTSPVIRHSTISNNSANEGGALYCLNSSPQIFLSRIDKNNAFDGGAFSLSNSQILLKQCLVCDNLASRWGAGIYSKGSNVTMINITMANNKASSTGGGIYFYDDNRIYIKNSIFAENEAEHGGTVFSSQSFHSPSIIEIMYTDIDTIGGDWLREDHHSWREDNYIWGAGNIFKNPQFHNSENGDYRLSPQSPCIDAGDPNDDTTEEPFPNGFRINMGAYGGTKRAALTSSGSLVVTPDPIDFGNLGKNEVKDLTVYLKNGRPSQIKITDIISSDPEHFVILGFVSGTGEGEGLVLESGTIDSITIKFDPKGTDKQSFTETLTVKTADSNDKIFKIFARNIYGTLVESGDVSGVWVKEDSPYNINGNIAIPANETLVIQPGVTVMFMGEYIFQIVEDAQLIARGSETDSIRFTPVDTLAGWQGFWFEQSSNDDTLSYCIISHIKIRYDQDHSSPIEQTAAITMFSSSPIIDHCHIKHNLCEHFSGIIHCSNSSPSILYSFFSKNSFGSNPLFYCVMSSPVMNGTLMYENSGRNVISGWSSNISLSNVVITQHKPWRISSNYAIIELIRDNNMLLKNSIIWDNSQVPTISLGDNNKAIIQYSNLDTTYADWIIWKHDDPEQKGEIIYNCSNHYTDPLFIDAENADFHLRPNSPCIDTGNPNDDFGEEPFPHGYRINMGIWGGTSQATSTQNALLTVTPNPLDFGKVLPNMEHQRILYLKNGSPVSINVNSATLDNSQNFSLYDFTGNELAPNKTWLLSPGDVDSILVKFRSTEEIEQINNTELYINSSECGSDTLVVKAHTLFGTQIVGGAVLGTWTKTNSPYNIFEDISIAAGKSLQINPGVTVRFMGQFGINVGEDTQLLAIGAEDDSITFCSRDTVSDWQGITFNNSGDDDIIDYCVFKNSQASTRYQYYGGAIELISTSPQIAHSTFINNSARYHGGAIYCRDSNLKIDHSVFESNDASQMGGALYIYNSTIDIKNCLFHKNTAEDGAVIYGANSAVTLTNATLVRNQASRLGGVLCFQSGNNVWIKNSIIWENKALSGEVAYFDVNTILQCEYSDIDTTGEYWLHGLLGMTGELIWGHGNICANPLFGDAENGNFSLQPQSPCIDAGDPMQDVDKEPFPNGYRINMGMYGATSQAAQTTQTVLTVSPYPIDFGIIAVGERSGMEVFLKNGCPNSIQITSISTSNPDHFSLFNVPEIDQVISLSSGDVVTIGVRFIASPTSQKFYSDTLKIKSPGFGELKIHLFAESFSGTVVQPGYVSGRWVKENSPYNVFGEITIQENKELLIEPGVTIRFHGFYGFQVGENAQLRAIGAPKDSIKLCAADPLKGWSGILFENSSNDDTLKYCIITNGKALGSNKQSNGGALIIAKSSPSILHSLFKNNTAKRGGAIYCDESSVNISHCVLAKNLSQEHGGAIYLYQSSPTILNTMICENEAMECGGAIFCSGQKSTPIFENVTITKNMAKYGSLIYLENQAFIKVKNSVLWNNTVTNPRGYVISYGSNSGESVVQVEYSDIDTTQSKWLDTSTEFERLYWGEGNIVQDPLFVNPAENDFSLQENSPCIDAGDPNSLFNDLEDDANPGYALWPSMGTLRNDMGAFGGGSSYWFTQVENDDKMLKVPDKIALFQNYPNPFSAKGKSASGGNPTTTIRFDLPNEEKVSIIIFNVLGRRVRTLINQKYPMGRNEISWDGKSDAGETVSSGIYIYAFHAGKFRQNLKMLLIR